MTRSRPTPVLDCTRCGWALPEGERECRHCGYILNAEVLAQCL